METTKSKWKITAYHETGCASVLGAGSHCQDDTVQWVSLRGGQKEEASIQRPERREKKSHWL